MLLCNYGSDSQRSMQTGPVRPKPGADIEVGKHAKDIKDTPKENVQLNLSNKLAKRLEDEEKKKRLIRRCDTSLPSVTLHTFPLSSRQTHVSSPSRVKETRLLKTRDRQRIDCSQH